MRRCRPVTTCCRASAASIRWTAPGFPADVVAGDRYRAVADRIVKIIPDSSIVGMILDSPEHCVVVKSNEYGPMQHLAFSWQVDRDRFVTVPEVGRRRHANSNVRWTGCWPA